MATITSLLPPLKTPWTYISCQFGAIFLRALSHNGVKSILKIGNQIGVFTVWLISKSLDQFQNVLSPIGQAYQWQYKKYFNPFCALSTLNRKMKSYKLPLSKFRNCREHSNFMITHNKMYMWARTYMIMDNGHVMRDFFQKYRHKLAELGRWAE